MSFSRIIGTGSYVPKKVLSNADLEKMVETNDEWIVKRTGIKRRHIAADDETTCTMAETSARRALEVANKTPDDIDLIIVATCTSGKVFPSTACMLQNHLAIKKNIPAFDVSAACSGYIYALGIADQMIRGGMVKTALVVGGETLSRIIDWEDRATCILFGDGAGAVILEQSDEPGIYSTHLHAQGSYKDILYLDNDMVRTDSEQPRSYVQANGKEVFKLAVNELSNAAEEALTHNNMTIDDVDWLIPHQANLRIITAMAKRLNFPMERVVSNLQELGNTSAASVPLAFDEAIRDGRIQRGQTILLEGIGGGMAWGSVLLKY